MTRALFDVTNAGCKPHLFEEVENYVQKWSWLVPTWMHELSIKETQEQPENALAMTICEEYRSAFLEVTPSWANQPVDVRERFVLHELIHLHTNHVFMVALQIIEATMEENSALAKWSIDEAHKAVEKGTNDLERALWLLLNPLS